MPNSERSAGRRFDHDYGVTTQAILFLGDLDPETVGDAGAHATHYEPVPVEDFRALLSHVPNEVVRLATFVDIGAGMGRAVLLASEYPFKHVRGIEVSPSLYEVARSNLERAEGSQRRCGDIHVTRADARLCHYPSGDLVVFLYNPFDAEALAATFERVMNRPASGATWLLYHTPIERDVIEANPRWDIIAEIPSGIVYRWT